MDPESADITEIYGFHGCDLGFVESIRNEGFRIGESRDLWLGPGVYFFIEGLCCPIEASIKWAIVAAWDKDEQKNRYRTFAVLKARIRSRRPFDANTDQGKRQIIMVREKLMNGIKKARPAHCYDNQAILKFLAEKLDFDVIIYDLFTRFRQERIQNHRSNFPNTRVVCVRYPATTIDKGGISVVKTGEVPNHNEA